MKNSVPKISSLRKNSFEFQSTKDHNYTFYKIRIHLFPFKKLFLLKQINFLALYFFQNLNKLGKDFIRNRRDRKPAAYAKLRRYLQVFSSYRRGGIISARRITRGSQSRKIWTFIIFMFNLLRKKIKCVDTQCICYFNLLLSDSSSST